MTAGVATVRIDNRLRIFNRLNEAAMELALERMRQDIWILSQFKVPRKSGTLKSSGKQKKIGRLHHQVSYGETAAEDYAAYQHRGMRRDGSHIVRNYTTAGTQKDYLGESGAIIASKASNYFKQEANKVRV